MSKKEIDKLSYTEALKLVLKILDEHGNQIKSLDDRERLIQKTLERLAGKEEGKKEAVRNWKWHAGFLLGILGFILTILMSLWEFVKP